MPDYPINAYIRWLLRTCCASMKVNGSFRRKRPICDGTRSTQIPGTDQITEIAPLTCAAFSKVTSNIGTVLLMLIFTGGWLV